MEPLLIDLSAWARSGHPAVRERWTRLIEGDRLRCHAVFALELLHGATDAASFHHLRNDLDAAFDWFALDDETAEIALRLQQRMSTRAPTAQRVKTADLLIAALAVQHGAGVLHYDADFDLILERGGERFHSEWLASRGSLESIGSARKAARRPERPFEDRVQG